MPGRLHPRIVSGLLVSLGFMMMMSSDCRRQPLAGELKTIRADPKPATIPLYINFETYCSIEGQVPNPAEFVRTARDSWGFDGIELSVGRLLKKAGSAKEYETLIADISRALEGNSQFGIHLTIDPSDSSTVPARGAETNEVLTAAKYAVRQLPVQTCSLILKSNAEEKLDAVTFGDFEKGLTEVKSDILVLIENPVVWTGAEIDRFVESVKVLPKNRGVLIVSGRVHYRFDLALQDLRLSTGGGQLPQAVRLHCTTSELSTSESAHYDREVCRRAIAEQIIPNSAANPILFISVESSKPLQLNTKPNANGQISVGSKTMRDMILTIRNEFPN